MAAALAKATHVRICAYVQRIKSPLSPSRKSARGRSFGLRFLFRLIGWSFSAAIAFIVITYLALPALLRYGLPHALARYGVVSSVDGARVSLTNERVTLVGFQVGQAGGPAIRWGEVTARVDVAELLKGNIRIIDFQVKDARVDLAQLQASEWKPPDRAAAIPELKKLKIDVGNVVLRDLEFIGLSDRVGQKVELRSLSLGSLSHLEAGARVAFQMEGVAGDGSLRLAGQARMVDNLPVFEGRYELAALDLKGFGHLFGLATPRSVGGKVDGSGTFGLSYLQGDGVVHADLSGSARVDGLELDSGETSMTKTTVEWNGDAEVFWPVAGGRPRLIGRGSLISPTLEAARRTTAAPYGILVRGLRWSGEIRHGSEFEIDGALDGDLLRIDTGREGEPRLELELSRLSANSRYQSGRGWYEFETDKLTAESAKLFQPQDRGRQSLVAFKLLLERVRLSVDGYHVGRLKAESAEATVDEHSKAKASRSARFISLDASGIEISAGSGIRIKQLETEQAGFDFHEVSINLSKARGQGIAAGAEAQFEFETLSASSLRQITGMFETWGSTLQFSRAGISASGEFYSDEAAAESLSQTMSGDPIWEASSVHAARLSIGSRQIETGKLSSGRFAYGKFGGDLIEIERGEGVDFSIQYGSGIDAGAVKLGSMHYRSGQLAVLEFAESELKDPGITFQGELSAERVDADQARYLDADGDVSLFEMLKLGKLSGRISTGIHIDAAHAQRLFHDSAVGADYDAAGLDFSRLQFSDQGEASSVAGRLDSLDVALSDGVQLTLEDVAAAHPALNAVGIFAADGGRARTLSYSMPRNRILKILNVEVGAVDGDENDGHRISSVSAASATASDPEAGSEIETGSLRIAAIRISADRGVRADQASADEVSVTSLERNPSAAFSSARIVLNALALEKGELTRVGEVHLDAAALTMGLGDDGEFVLPELPFFSGDHESSVSFILERLETRQPARLSFFDRSTSPPFEAVIFPLQARLENFHSNDTGRRAKFMLDGRIDEFSNLKASGVFSTERDGLNLEVSGKVAAFELNRLNMYASKHAKRAVRSGHGDAEFDVAVRGRKLSGNIRFVFSKVKFERSKSLSASEGENQAELSLQNSFAMLKDKDGVVRLTVPLSGSLDDPRFNFSDGLVQALIKTVRNTVMLTFKPLGLLVGAAGLVGSPEGLEFSPVAFDPGEPTLSGQGLAHLDALARELKKHPGVEVRICGRAVSADRIRIEQRRSEGQPQSAQDRSGSESVDFVLQNLAQQRASTVRRYLEQKKQVTPGRLLNCEASVEPTPGRLPRVDLPVRVDHESTAAPDTGSPG